MRPIMIVMALCAVAHADDVTVDQAIEQYHRHSARLVADRAGIEVAGADLVEAGIYPNPTIGVSGSRTLGGSDTIGGNQLALSLDVPILIGHQRGKREAAATAKIEAARADSLVLQGEGELTVRDKFAALLAAQDRATALGEALADAKVLRELVAGRQTAGASSPYAVERIDLAIAALASRVDEAKAEQSSAAGELASSVGVPGWTPHAVAVPEVTTTGENPVILADIAAKRAAIADEDRAHADAIPTPSIGVQSFGTTDPSGFVGTLGISIPLPLFDRNQGAIARARAEEHRADLELAAHRAELAADLARATTVLAARRDGLAHFEADALQRLAKLRTMAETSYRSGQGGIVELLDALDAITDAKLRAIDLRTAVAQAELDVRRATLGR